MFFSVLSTVNASVAGDLRELIALAAFDEGTAGDADRLGVGVLSADGTRYAVSRLNDAQRGNWVEIYDTSNGKMVAETKDIEGSQGNVSAISDDGKFIAMDLGHDTAIVDCATGKLLGRTPGAFGAEFLSDEEVLVWNSENRRNLVPGTLPKNLVYRYNWRNGQSTFIGGLPFYHKIDFFSRSIVSGNASLLAHEFRNELWRGWNFYDLETLRKTGEFGYEQTKRARGKSYWSGPGRMTSDGTELWAQVKNGPIIVFDVRTGKPLREVIFDQKGRRKTQGYFVPNHDGTRALVSYTDKDRAEVDWFDGNGDLIETFKFPGDKRILLPSLGSNGVIVGTADGKRVFLQMPPER